MLISDSHGTEGQLLAEGTSNSARVKALGDIDQRQIMRVYEYVLQRRSLEARKDGDVRITQKRYGLNETCKRGQWKVMEGPNTITIPFNHREAKDALAELLA